MKTTLTDWFTASPGETDQLFYYDQQLGHADRLPGVATGPTRSSTTTTSTTATSSPPPPRWPSSTRTGRQTSQYGGMVDLLIRDANNYDRDDTRFPYLRDFDIYAGHDWASGHGAFAAGNNQESSSEGMNFANALIQWGQATGNTAVRDAGIFIYTTQAAAIADYWFDVDNDVLPGAVRPQHGRHGLGRRRRVRHLVQRRARDDPGHQHAADHRRPPVPRLRPGVRQEQLRRAGPQPTAASRRVWQDILWEFLALGDPDAALAKFRANRELHLRGGRDPRRTPSTGSATSPRWATSTPASPRTTRWPRCSPRTAQRTLRGANITRRAADGDVLRRHHADRRRPGRPWPRGAHHLERRQRLGAPGTDPTPTPTPTHHADPDAHADADADPTTPTPTPTPTRHPTPDADGAGSPGRYFLGR